VGQPAGLERQLVRQGSLALLGQALGMALRLGVQLMLARLLLPADFGRFGLALLAMTVLGAVVTGGLLPPAVRAGEDERATSTTLALAAGLGPVLFATAWLLGPIMAAVYGEPVLLDLVRVAGLGLVAGALAAPPGSVLERRRQVDRRVLAELGGAVSGALAMLALALAGAGPYALAWGWVTGELAGCGLTWRLAGWRPRARPSWPVARSLLAVGRFTAGSGLLLVATGAVDDAVVGAVLGMEALGYYGLAYGWANLLAHATAGPLSRVLFPTYLRAGRAPGQLADLYLSVARGSAVLVMPAAALLALLGPVAAPALLGPAWAPVGPLLPVLSVLLLAHGLGLSQGALLTALDRPHWRTACLAGELLILLLGLAPVARLGGLPAVAGLVVLAALATTGVGLALIQRMLALPARRLGAALWRPAAATLLAALALLATAPARAALDPLLALAAGGLPFAGTYGLALALLWPRARPADQPGDAGRSRPAGALHDR
jgi:PST family polysaccharide transporter